MKLKPLILFCFLIPLSFAFGNDVLSGLKRDIIQQAPRSHPFEEFHNLVSAKGAVISMRKYLDCTVNQGSYSELCREQSGEFTIYFNKKNNTVVSYYIPSIDIGTSIEPAMNMLIRNSSLRLDEDEAYTFAFDLLIYKFNYYAPRNLVYGKNNKELTLQWTR